VYLINSHFKGDWTQQFDRSRTAARPFGWRMVTSITR
jgi:hypothetical protein